MKITRFEDIKAWQAARTLEQEFDRVASHSKGFKNRTLAKQMADCADSGMANIVEGFDSGSDREFLRFLQIAFRSLSEFQSHLYVALDQVCVDPQSFDRLYKLARDAKGLNGGFQRYLKKCLKEGRPGIQRDPSTPLNRSKSPKPPKPPKSRKPPQPPG